MLCWTCSCGITGYADEDAQRVAAATAHAWDEHRLQVGDVITYETITPEQVQTMTDTIHAADAVELGMTSEDLAAARVAAQAVHGAP